MVSRRGRFSGRSPRQSNPLFPPPPVSLPSMTMHFGIPAASSAPAGARSPSGEEGSKPRASASFQVNEPVTARAYGSSSSRRGLKR